MVESGIEGVMNLSTHGLQMTCPQGMVSMAFKPLERPFLQAGQMRVRLVVLSEEPDWEDLVEVEEGLEVLKITGTRVLRERG